MSADASAIGILYIGSSSVTAAACEGDNVTARAKSPLSGDARLAINTTIDEIETEINKRIDEVIVITSEPIKSYLAQTTIKFRRAREVTSLDTYRAIRKVKMKDIIGKDIPLHIIPIHYSAQIGEVADGVSAALHIVAMPESLRAKICLLARGANMEPIKIISAAFAEGKGQEVKDGAIIDIGAESVRVGIFAKGRFTYSFCIDIGANSAIEALVDSKNVTWDDAEALVLKYGAKAPSGLDFTTQVSIDVAGMGETVIPKADILMPINSAYSELYRLVCGHLEEAQGGAFKKFLKNTIITGSGSKISGAQDIFGARLEESKKTDGAAMLRPRTENIGETLRQGLLETSKKIIQKTRRQAK